MDYPAKTHLDGICASEGVDKIIREITLKRQGAIKMMKRLGSVRSHAARSASTILKAKAVMNCPGPWSLQPISQKLKISFTIIKVIIKRDLGEKCDPSTTHHLQKKIVTQRLENVLSLPYHLIHNSWSDILGLNETWCCPSHVNGRRKIFHESHGKKESGKLKQKLCTNANPREIMFVTEISASGTTVIHFVSSDAKVNANVPKSTKF